MIDRLRAVSGRDVSRETCATLLAYQQLLLAENERQNLVSRSSAEAFWDRHILDSAQLVRFGPAGPSGWLDIGSGPGLPGLVIAIITGEPVTLLEPRALRAGFLERAKAALDLPQVTVVQGKATAIQGQFGCITARAVASLDALFAMAHPLAAAQTRWVLPKGKSAQKEVEAARQNWQGDIRVEPSLTSDEAWIVVASAVAPRRRGGK